MATRKDVETENSEALATQETAIGMPIDFAADAGAGTENITSADMSIPFIIILQGLSPNIGVDGRLPGLFCNSVTGELFKEITVIPCAYQRRFIRWHPRTDGGGYIGDYDPILVESGKIEGIVKGEDGKLTIEGDELKDTRIHYVLIQDSNGQWSPAIMSLSSVMIKKSKRWLAQIAGLKIPKAPGSKTLITPPMFSHIYKGKPCEDKNKKGNWKSVDFEIVSTVTDADVYALARKFHHEVASGSIKVQPIQDDNVETEEGNDDKF